jgi:hypothetical protein
MIVSETELHPQREVVLQYLRGHTCDDEDIMHFDSFQITNNHCERERERGRNLNYTSSYEELERLSHL